MPEDKNQSELDKFFEGVKSDSPQLNLEEKVPEKEPEKKEEVEEEKPNRQQRRATENASIRKQLEESRIAQARAEARAEALSERKLGDGTVDDRLLRLYGDNENGRLAAKLHAEMLEDVRKQAEDNAYKRYQDEQIAAKQEEEKESSFIQENLNALEDSYGIDLTSNSPAGRKARTDFLAMVEKLSPKDKEGNIIEYADFDSAFEMFQNSKKKDNSQRKELADRSMTRSSGEPNQAQSEKTAWDKGREQLRAMGLNV